MPELTTEQVFRRLGLVCRPRGAKLPEVRVYNPREKRVDIIETPVKAGRFGIKGSGHYKKALQSKLAGPIGSKLWVEYAPQQVEAYHKIQLNKWEVQ